MTQWQFEVIISIISKGAPALAEELCGALDALVKDRNALAEKVRVLEEASCDCENSCEATQASSD